MAYRVAIDPSALKQLAKLDRQIRDRVQFAIDKLAEDPRPPGCKKLKALPGYRIRVADKYRVIYEVHDAVLLVRVVKVANRGDIYDR